MKRLEPLLGLCIVITGGGCLEEQRYVIENESVAMTSDTAVAFVDDDDNEFFVVERTFGMPIRTPSDRTLGSLATRAQGMNLPYPRLPWVERKDFEIELDYVLANLTDQDVVAGITLDGINEFFEYTPGPEDFHQWERRFALKPRERKTGTISELEMDEIAIDLATVVNGAPNSNQVVQFQSQSGRDPRVKRYVPKVVPSLVGFRAGVTMTGQAADVVLEISVRVQDHGDRLAERGTSSWELPEPAPFTPVAEEEE